MHNLNFSFENDNGIVEESYNHSIDDFIEEAQNYGMTVTRIGNIVNICHDDPHELAKFVKMLDTSDD